MAGLTPISGATPPPLVTVADLTAHPRSQAPSFGAPGAGSEYQYAHERVDQGAGDRPQGIPLVNAISAFHDAMNAWAAKNPLDAAGLASVASAAGAAFAKNSQTILAGIAKYGASFGAAVNGLANGTLKVVGGVLEGVSDSIPFPVFINTKDLYPITTTISALGGPGSPAASAFGAGVAGVASWLAGFNGAG